MEVPTYTIAIGIGIGAVIAAFISSVVSRQIKVSEFRQAWIDGLRDELSDYFNKATMFVDFYNEYQDSLPDQKPVIKKQIDSFKYEGLRVLVKINLRFKYADEDGDLFLNSIGRLSNPEYYITNISENKIDEKLWRDEYSSAVKEARILLKKEWEVAKRPALAWLKSRTALFWKKLLKPIW